MIARHYVMIAKAGEENNLAGALDQLADAVLLIEGCCGCEILRDIDQPGRFHFIEKWESVEAHKAGSSPSLKDKLKPVMAALAGAPEGGYFDYVRTA